MKGNEDAMESPNSRSFSLENIRRFATVSGDPNPVHIDPEFAARTYPGAVAAHGLHLVLWALDTLPPEQTAGLSNGLKTVFQRPVVVGDEVQLDCAQPGVVRLRRRGEAMATIKFGGARPPEPWGPAASAHAPSHPPVVGQPPESFQDLSGALRLPDGRDELLATFPNIGKRLSPRVLQGLAGVATVSGAVLGGVTTEFSAAFSDDNRGDGMEYRVLSYHPALRRFELAFHGYGLIGKVAAMVGGQNGGEKRE
jgi:hypothetical protein